MEYESLSGQIVRLKVANTKLTGRIAELEARLKAAERELAEAQKAIEAHVELYRDASVRAERQTGRADSYARIAQACLRDAGPALVRERERAEKAEADAGRLRDALVRIIKRTQGCEPVLATDVRLIAEAALSPAEQAKPAPAIVKALANQHGQPFCVYLSDGKKIGIQRDGGAAWLRIEDTPIVRAAEQADDEKGAGESIDGHRERIERLRRRGLICGHYSDDTTA